MAQTPLLKRGRGIGYSGHKHQKGDKELTVAEMNGWILGILAVAPVNHHDSELLLVGFEAFVKSLENLGISLRGSAFTLDSGFDSRENRTLIKTHKLIPVIYPNRRNTKEPIAIARMFRWFDRKRYAERYRVERTYAWKQMYRKLVVSHDRLPEIRLGFRFLAYAMVNFRTTFDEKH